MKDQKLHVATSPLTNTIFAGTVLKAGVWGANKQDVTIEALTAVVNHVMNFGEPVEISTSDGVPIQRLHVEQLTPIKIPTKVEKYKTLLDRYGICVDSGESHIKCDNGDVFEKVPYEGLDRPEYILKNGKAFNIYGAFDYIIAQQDQIKQLKAHLDRALAECAELGVMGPDSRCTPDWFVSAAALTSCSDIDGLFDEKQVWADVKAAAIHEAIAETRDSFNEGGDKWLYRVADLEAYAAELITHGMPVPAPVTWSCDEDDNVPTFSDMPSKSGLYKYRCSETDDKWCDAAICEIEGDHMVIENGLGSTPLGTFHDGLTDLVWQSVAVYG